VPDVFHQTSQTGHILRARRPTGALSQLPAHCVLLGASPRSRVRPFVGKLQ
jgi:hypothetical protein